MTCGAPGQQQGTRRALTGLALAPLLVGCASAPRAPTAGGDHRPPIAAAAPCEALPCREVRLSDWGLGGVEDLGYARVGVLHQARPALVVYHLGRVDPQTRQRPAAAATPPPLTDGAFVVSRYRSGNKNSLGGYFNQFARPPARASVAIAEDRPGGGHALAFEYAQPPDTFASFWIHLFETRRPPAERTYLGRFVPSGRVERRWQRAWVPLSDLPERLDPSRLASVVFLVDPEASAPLSGRLFVRDVAFTVARELPRQLRPDRPEPDEAPPPPPRQERKAMWLWETVEVLDTPGALDTLTDFVVEHGFTDLFVQVPFADHAEGERHWSARWDTRGMRRLIGRIRAVGARVHALDGAAWYARPQWHERVVETLGQLAAYNAASAPEERLHGVRYDIEPYLLPEYAGARRARVLSDYLSLLERLVVVAHEAGLEIGVDIPFWFDARDEVTAALAAPVDEGPAAEAIIDLVDNVGIMDYRTTAYGADGVLAHAEGELAYADRVGKQVLIGLETVPLPDETIFIYDGGRRTRWDVAGDLVLEPLGGDRARLTFVPRQRRAADGRYPWAAPGSVLLRQRDALDVPASKITFATLRPADLSTTMRQARAELERHPSFSGFVIHSYESFRPWLRKDRQRRPADATTSPAPAAPSR